MKNLPFREVHLDFHTSELIKDIGSDFSKENFKAALIRGHVNSITVFAKCHHGMFYYPSEKFTTHPYLKKNLLKEMIEACHEIGVRVPVYISAGLDEYSAKNHPEWLASNKNGGQSFLNTGFHLMCFNTKYLYLLEEQTKEVVRNFDADAIFFDICGERRCYCAKCISDMLEKGLDPLKDEDCDEMASEVYANYCKRMEAAIHSIKPDMPIFHNGGHISRGRRDLADFNSHLELESLPTGGWGYDHFPLSARYVQQLGKEYLGMTGKFHTSWGEFGGYKHPNALIYETALSIAMGAKCSVGDQLHPSGMMDYATYNLIGEAFSRVEEREEWCDNVENVADIGILSQESIAGGRNAKGDIGANRIMLEGKFTYDILDLQSNFNKYKLIILPDTISITSDLKKKLDSFVKYGGKILCSGNSGLDENNKFVYDLGAEYINTSEYSPEYIKPLFNIDVLENAYYIVYGQGINIRATGTVLAEKAEPYFNRTYYSFCSHQHAPYNKNNDHYPAITEGENGIYISWPLFTEYAKMGSITTQKILIHLINKLLGYDKTITADIPTQGITTLMHQEKEHRYINHILYAIPVKRGEWIEVIEDIPALYGIDVKIRMPQSEKVKNVYIAPDKTDIPFTQNGCEISYRIPRHWCHTMVVIEY